MACSMPAVRAGSVAGRKDAATIAGEKAVETLALPFWLADVFRANASPEERERALTAWRDVLRALMLELIAGQGPRAWIVAVTGLFTMSLPRPTAPIESTFTMIAGARKKGATIYATIRAKIASPTPRITPAGGACGERVKRAIQGDLGATISPS